MPKEKLKFTRAAIIHEPGSSRATKTGEWRTFRPVIDQEKCTRCSICWRDCPDAAVKYDEKENTFTINYDYCKGCGICAAECPVKAIIMELEKK